MKKLGIYLLSMLAVTFTSCDDYNFDNPDAQMNEQEAILMAENVSKVITLGNNLDGQALNLNDYVDNANGVNVINFGAVKDLPSNQVFDVTMQISLTEDFAKAVDLKVNVNALENGGFAGYVTAQDWTAAHAANFSKGPKAKDTYYRFLVNLKNGTQLVRVGNADEYFCNGMISVTPIPSALNIEPAYYLIGTVNDWQVPTAIKFNHEGDDVYDNPVFTIKVDISEKQAADGWWWKILPQSVQQTGEWGSGDNSAFGVAENGSEELSGMLVGHDCGAGCIKEAGQWMITINLEEGTYSFTSAVDYLYTPGGANGWSPATSQRLRTSDYTNYAGFARLDPAGFKFASAPDWDHTNYGLGAQEGTLDTNGGNLTVAALGLYYCKANIATLTYSTDAVTTFGLIGDATEGGWDSSTALTPSADLLTWSGDVTLKGTGEFKFRANNAWDINLGGSLTDLVEDGSNIATPGAGTYRVTLNLTTLPYTATVVKK